MVSLIAAVSRDGFISRGTGVPWDLPADRRHFRAHTAGKWLLVGRITCEEMRGWFGDHTPLVLTHDEDFVMPRGHAVKSADDAVHLARDAGQAELMVIGGGQVFAATMPLAHRLLITWVDDELGAGVRFPDINLSEWELIADESPADRRDDEPRYRFTTYRRRS